MMFSVENPQSGPYSKWNHHIGVKSSYTSAFNGATHFAGGTVV